MNYCLCDSIEQTLTVLIEQAGQAKIIAGGTDLIPQMRAGRSAPETLVDIRKLPLNQVHHNDSEVRLGAGLTHTDILRSADLADLFPALLEACRQVAAPPIRNRGTLGGNLANASPAADTAPALLIYDAEVILEKQGSSCRVAVSDFFTGPGRTQLEPCELLTLICLPLPPEKTGAAFLKLGRRSAMAVAVVSAAAAVSFDAQGCICRSRIAIGSAAPTPLRIRTAEVLLEGCLPNEENILAAARAAASAASPISDVRASAAYRRRMVEVLTTRALRLAINRGLQGAVQ
jgi:CO/xanthine dehydrogenase FAD-binding subunit